MLFPSSATFVRYFSKKRAVNPRKINPKVPLQEASTISKSLYQIIKDNGPITVSNTWNQAKDAGISGLNSKTHMKLMLKWMRGRKMLKLFCTPVGSNKKFLHSTLPEEPQTSKPDTPPPSPERKKSSPKKQKPKK
ncbi:tumor necrosis factor receptor family protein [Tasmannia lanceolata]|uniref:tumor necrosis factor receptor family protein n=1 Tax=Tasmannia lanceolata TaxID=3420 RepID=UPI0040641E16